MEGNLNQSERHVQWLDHDNIFVGEVLTPIDSSSSSTGAMEPQKQGLNGSYDIPPSKYLASELAGDADAAEVGASTDGKIGGGSRWGRFWQKTGLSGGSDSAFDAWLTATTAQVGNIVLTLPYALSQTGIVWAVGCLVGFGLLGWWAVYLLSWMYFDFKAKLHSQGKPLPEGHVTQYHEVIGGVIGGRTGTLAGYVTILFAIGGNAMGGVIQIVSAASNLYYANNSFDKRQWTFVTGSVALLSIFLPDFKHFRAISVMGVFTSSFVAMYLLFASHIHGQVENVRHSGRQNNLLFFTGVTNIIFTFGGHNITIEIMDAMKRPSKFKYIYLSVVGYTLAVVIPSGISVYWAYGDILLNRANAFSVVPKSQWRTGAIALMVSHQVIIYTIVVVTVFIAFEKGVGVHTGRYIMRLIARIPIFMVIWFTALAIPFFGIINSLMAATLVTMGGYVIPPLFFAIAYRTAAAREVSASESMSSVQQPPLIMGRSWTILFIVNGIIVTLMVVVGMGWGGWASVSNLILQIKTVGFFAPCYQCSLKPK